MKAKQIVAIMCLLGLDAIAFAGSKPNVVMLLSDDHMASALGCAGDPTVKTPNIDRLASSGVRFTRAFSPNPICTPARAALLTGQSSTTSGVTFFNKPIPERAVTWPETLRNAGYVTFYTGKWHNDLGPARRGFVRGKAIFFGGMGDHEHLPVRDIDDPRPRRADKFSSTLFADAAIEFLDGYKADAPFCLYVAFTAPHDPRTPPVSFATLYDPAKILIPPNFRFEPPVELFTREIRDEKLLPFPRLEADIRRERALYYGMITHLDEQIGRILDAIERTGQAGNTLVIFAGDQGLALGAHGVVGKQTLYEEGIRTPLIVRDPRTTRGAPTCDRLVELVDLYPTICEVAGIEVPPGVEGRSLLPLYRGEDCPVRGQVYGLYDDLQRCVRTERYKYILHLKSGAVELFDLRADPFELNNLAGHRESADVEEDLRGRLDRWRASTQHAAEAPAADR
jgi:arylsulfatase A-like enzyme